MARQSKYLDKGLFKVWRARIQLADRELSIIRELKGNLRTDSLNTTASLAALPVTQRLESFLHQEVRFLKVSNSEFTDKRDTHCNKVMNPRPFPLMISSNFRVFWGEEYASAIAMKVFLSFCGIASIENGSTFHLIERILATANAAMQLSNRA
jgi:hypothetical protein